jgi:transposase
LFFNKLPFQPGNAMLQNLNVQQQKAIKDDKHDKGTGFLQHRKKYSGFFCIMSNKIKDAQEALSVYRNKDVVENCFDDLKNHLDMKRLRVHSAKAMDGRLFLQFLALIYISTIRNTIKKDEKLKYMTVREVMEEMETMVKVKYSNRYG